MIQKNKLNLFNEVSENLREARYVILSGRTSPNSPSFPLYKNVYELWKKTWKKTFGDVGSLEKFSPDDFYRQDLIPVIAYKDEPIAAHFYTFFDIANPVARDHHYFEIFSALALSHLTRNRAQKLMSMEYLTVAPEYRKSKSGLSFAEILIVLGCHLLRAINYDVALGVAVKAATVDQMAIKLGFELLDNNAKRGNLICDIMGFYNLSSKLPQHPDVEINDYILSLWQNVQNKTILLNER